MYPCVSPSTNAFVHQLAYDFINHNGYRFYVTGSVTPRLEPWEHDARIIKTFRTCKSPNRPSEQKPEDKGRIQYLRRNNFWVLISTHAQNGNALFVRNIEAVSGKRLWYSVEHRAIKFGGYAIRVHQGEVCIKLDYYKYKQIKKELLELAKYVPAGRLTPILKQKFHYTQYQGVQVQLDRLVRCLNERLKKSNLGRIEFSDVKSGWKAPPGRRIYTPEEMYPEMKRRAA